MHAELADRSPEAHLGDRLAQHALRVVPVIGQIGDRDYAGPGRVAGWASRPWFLMASMASRAACGSRY